MSERRVTINDATPAEWDASVKSLNTNTVPKVMPEGSVGDVNSTARGSGARYNAGKPSLELLPLRIIYEYFMELYCECDDDALTYSDALACLWSLALWQETGDAKHLRNALMGFTLMQGECILTESARVFDYGRKKYAEWNWAKGMAWSIPLGCAVRHLMAMMDGELLDPESGLPHRGHVASNIVMLLTFMQNYPEGDDRPRMLAPVPLKSA